MRQFLIHFLVGCLSMVVLTTCASKSHQQQQQQDLSPDTKSTPKQKEAAEEAKKAKPTPDPYSLAKSAALKASLLKRQMGVASPLRITHVPMEGKYVALTFDDGPSLQYTSKVLDVLKKYNAKGTFFVLGYRLGSGADILKRADAEGHEIGVHTWSHINMRASSSDTVYSEMNRTTRRIFNLLGKYPTVMRPPYGATSSALVNSVYNQFAQKTILWDVDTRDWTKPGVNTVTQRAVWGARPGSIILVHDIHGSTFAALEPIVQGLQQRGFKLVTVSELMALRGCKEQEAERAEENADEKASASVSQAQPQPANQAQPQPANQAQPQPANQAQPQPANQAQPQPANQAQPQPANQAQPQPANQAQPQPVQAGTSSPAAE